MFCLLLTSPTRFGVKKAEFVESLSGIHLSNHADCNRDLLRLDKNKAQVCNRNVMLRRLSNASCSSCLNPSFRIYIDCADAPCSLSEHMDAIRYARSTSLMEYHPSLRENANENAAILRKRFISTASRPHSDVHIELPFACTMSENH